VIDLKLNGKRLGLHWQYYRWRYLIIIAAAVLAANLLLSVTRPQIPNSQKVDISVYGSISDAVSTAWESDILRMLPPDQKEVTISSTPALSGQDVSEVLVARLTGKEGTIYILPKGVKDSSGNTVDYFTGQAMGGAFMPLDNLLSQLNLPKSIDLKAGTVTVQADDTKPAETHVCGIPLDSFKGLAELMGDGGMTGMVLAIPYYATDNLPNTLSAINWLLSKTAAPEANVDPNRFTVTIASDFFSSYDTTAWQTALNGKLSLAPGVGFSLMPFATGREDTVTKDLTADRTGKPGIMAVSRDVFVALARGGFLMPLDDSMGKLNIPAGTDLAQGKETAKTDGKTLAMEHQYGIPLDNCRGLTDVFNPSGMMLVIPTQNAYNLSVDIEAANWMLGK
jgi:hypothetical protein